MSITIQQSVKQNTATAAYNDNYIIFNSSTANVSHAVITTTELNQNISKSLTISPDIDSDFYFNVKGVVNSFFDAEPQEDSYNYLSDNVDMQGILYLKISFAISVYFLDSSPTETISITDVLFIKSKQSFSKSSFLFFGDAAVLAPSETVAVFNDFPTSIAVYESSTNTIRRKLLNDGSALHNTDYQYKTIDKGDGSGTLCKWRNNNGGYSYWLFERELTENIKISSKGQYNKNLTSNTVNEISNFVELQKNLEFTVALETKSTDYNDYVTLVSLYESNEIYLFTGGCTDTISFIRCSLKNTTKKTPNKHSQLPFEIELQLPNGITQEYLTQKFNKNTCANIVPIVQPILLVNNVMHNSISLEWTYSDKASSFNLEMREGNGNYTIIQTLASDVSNATVENLSPETTYTFRIQALVGEGYSNEVTATTLFAFSMVTNANAQGTGNTNYFQVFTSYSAADTPMYVFENGYISNGKDIQDFTGLETGLDGTEQTVLLLMQDKTAISSFRAHYAGFVGSLDFSVFVGAVFNDFDIQRSYDLTSINLNVLYDTSVNLRVYQCGLTSVVLNTASTSKVSYFSFYNNELTTIDRGSLVFDSTNYRVENNNLTDLDLNVGDTFSYFNISNNDIASNPENFNQIDLVSTATYFNIGSNTFDPDLPTSFTGRISFFLMNHCGKTGVLDLSNYNFRENGVCEIQAHFTDITGIINPVIPSTSFVQRYWVHSNPNWNQTHLDVTGIRLAPTTSQTSNFDIHDQPIETISSFANDDGQMCQVVISQSNLQGVLDWSKYEFRGTQYLQFDAKNNPNLTGINIEGQLAAYRTIDISNTGFTVTNLTTFISNLLNIPIANNNGTLNLSSLNYTTAEVNQALEALDNHLQDPGYAVTINISGTNAAPDSSAGGFDGTAAITSLINKNYNVTVST